ncbi:Ger(x)C family spore germination protein [Clostridium luticellarii]|jgi:Ger(x)C family germination protein/spore germination protein (amino acid permease)|uniref:Spore germination protein A2 n=1 Tax=Clostridium luticellarii TaxID=1691940 RepID=A0A2T0BB97_9CLOT|nr:Ger(x)C family spore germination protein [Clostridium luticellarii]MCI1945283.1 Ger(x)C family spore germination protein [Clostridium luticellarii]MCI1968656.1 Ger(x)C family spore germination protein [Clostridium luticellarii]MCI1995836.1 Ger(x)C family spore germination protein [Clostridium luticellarii]MCI2040130.1 Ger(x)C family spore germination protein [Clostridium luticellarii]PRR81115.1 Spore germination protein A2 [Clostridium luticellarii]
MRDRDFITNFEIFSTIIVTVIGVGIFSLPRELVSTAGTDGWFVTIMAGVGTYFLLYMAYKTIKSNGYNKLSIILENNFGKILGGILAVIFVVYNVFAISIGMRIFVEVIKMYLLEKTPTEFLIVVTIFSGIYLVRSKLENLIKFNEVSFWIMFISLGMILIFTLNKADFSNILPAFSNTPYTYLVSLKSAVYSFAGIEIIYLIGPFIKNKSYINRTALKSILFITIFYVIVVVFSLAIFSKKQTEILLWPTITMIDSININGAFIERWEGIVMAMWVMFYFTTFSNIYYLSSDIIKDVFRLGDINLSSALIAPFIYVIALYPQNIAEIYDIGNKFIPPLFIYSLIVLPIFILLFGKVRNTGSRGKAIFLLLICIVLTGCWDKVEIDRVHLVSIIGVDAGADIGKKKEVMDIKPTDPLTSVDLKKFHVTFGIPDLSKLEPGKGGILQDKYINVDGYSIQDAVSGAIAKSSRSMRFSHTKILVLGENLMKYPESVKEVIDYLQREPSLNRNMYIVMSDGDAEKYIKFNTPAEMSVENYILGMVESDLKNSTVIPVTLNDFLVQMSENGNSIVPRIVMDKDDKNIKVSGTFAIKSFAQKGVLNSEQTSDIELLKGILRGGKKVIYLDEHPVDIRIDNVDRKIKMVQRNGKLVFNVDLYIEGQIKNYYTDNEALSVNKLNQIQHDFNESIGKECRNVVKYTQKDLQVDPVGFGEYVEKYHPDVWKQVKNNWDGTYKNAVININVNTNIRRIGATK